MAERLRYWLIRALLAALLLLGSEILFWNNPAIRTLPEWGLLAAGYLLLAAIVLDLIMRYRVRDVWGMMLVFGIYGVLNGLLLNPTTVLETVPNTLLSHALGGHWLIGLEMIGAFLVLLNGSTWQRKRQFFMGALVVGFFWGVWVYWFPAFNLGAYTPVQLIEMVSYAAVCIAIALILYGFVRQYRHLPVEGLQLSLREWALVAPILAVVWFIHITQQSIGAAGLLLSALLIAIFWVVLWFRGDTRKPSLLAAHMPMQPLGWLWVLMGIIVLGLAGAGGMMLPLVEIIAINDIIINQFTLLTIVFSAIGVLWMPLLAAVLGYKAFAYQMQTWQY